jgi:hypothetical protein
MGKPVEHVGKIEAPLDRGQGFGCFQHQTADEFICRVLDETLVCGDLTKHHPFKVEISKLRYKDLSYTSVELLGVCDTFGPWLVELADIPTAVLEDPSKKGQNVGEPKKPREDGKGKKKACATHGCCVVDELLDHYVCCSCLAVVISAAVVYVW